MHTQGRGRDHADVDGGGQRKRKAEAGQAMPAHNQKECVEQGRALVVRVRKAKLQYS
jgi:hypothetical protein